MKFLIQTIDKEIKHDFAFTLLESIRYQNWLQKEEVITYQTLEYHDKQKDWFKLSHEFYVPVGSVEFVLSWMKRFGVPTPTPINIPDELNQPHFTHRPVINGTHTDIEDLVHGKWFVKSATQFKGFAEVLRIDDNHSWSVPEGNYQMSTYINIESEWRAFVYKGELVGLQNYGGDFTKFPNIHKINHMIHNYKSAPVAYTLDVGVDFPDTFIIEVHDFFSCGLYGFAEHKIYPYMLYRWFHEYLKKCNN